MKIKNLLKKTAVLAALLLFTTVSVIPERAAAAAMGVPMYEYPTIGTLWADMIAADSDTVPFLIANPGNGPGASVDATYTTYINNAVASGKRVLGYVHTNYQARNYQDVFDDIDDWYQMYPQISGIFIDLIEDNTAQELCYAAGLYNHVKNVHPSDLVILNPGTNISPDYEPYGDIFMNAENTFAVYQSTWSIMHPGWEDNPLYRNRFWHAIHTTSGPDLNTALSLMQSRNAGWFYVTDDTMPNPYKLTPTYLNAEISAVDALPATTIPNRGKTQLPSGCQNLTASTSETKTPGAKQAKVASAITVNNAGTYNVEPATSVAFTLPAGVTLAGSGMGWTCDNDSCAYASTINAASNAAVLGAEFTASCDYSSGNVSAVLSNFAGNTSNFSIAPERPTDCAVLADTGLTTGITTAAAVGLVAAAFGVRFAKTRLHYVHRMRDSAE
jgi:hypothetical protein